MLLPVALVLLAMLATSMVAYGTQPVWGSYHHGISLILWSRRMEWPLIVLAFLLCAAVFVLIVSGKKKAWWFIGFLPILAIASHRLTHGSSRGLTAFQDPLYIQAATARSLLGGDLVVGVIVEGQPTAFPCASLFRCPVVVRTGRDKPMVLIYTPWVNRALAFAADRELRAADLEIVSTPDNSLVIYNTRLGEFINSVTGRTFDGAIPTGFHSQLNVVKTTWQNWQALYPDTVIAVMPGAPGDFFQPQPEKDRLPGIDPELQDERRVCLIASTQPIAVPSQAVTDRPLNLNSGQTPLLVVRVDGIVRAFSRELPGDLIPRFSPLADPKHKAAAWIDSDTNSEWSNAGAQIAGPKETHGLTLRPVALDDDLYWNVIKFWYPDLHLATDSEITGATLVEQHPVEKPPPQRRRRSKVDSP